MSSCSHYSSTSSSSSSSSSHPHVSVRFNPELTIKQTIDISEKHFTNSEEEKSWNRAARFREKAICQIHTSNLQNSGSGFLIGGNLLITNQHVLPSQNRAERGFARFFQVVFQNSTKTDTTVRTIQITLRPDLFFYTPGEGRRTFPEPGEDFTVVALDIHPYLSEIRDNAFSLFEDEVIPPDDLGVCVLHHPNIIDSHTTIKGDLKRSYGMIKKIEPDSVKYDAPTLEGSSGGAVIDINRRLIALHSESTQLQRIGEVEVLFNSGVPLARIVAALADQRIEMEKWLKIDLPSIPASSAPVKERIDNLPRFPHLFTGREKELADLHSLCTLNNLIAVSGLGGIGKSTLVAHYLHVRRADYDNIFLIESDNYDQIERGLLKLADRLNIEKRDSKTRLDDLKATLEGPSKQFLLVFDGLDDVDHFQFVLAWIPTVGNTKVLITSRFEDSLKGSGFALLPMKKFSQQDAADYLLKAVEGKDSDLQGAKELADTLGRLPLALKHAVALIRRPIGYTFRSYTDAFNQRGLELLRRVKLEKGEQTILKTWDQSIEAIRKNSQGIEILPEDILNLFSMFGNAPIPFEIERFLTFTEELDRREALNALVDYSLIEISENGYILHPLVRQVMRHNLKDTLLGYLKQAIDVLYRVSEELDVKDPRISVWLEPYISHFESIIESSSIAIHDPEDQEKLYSLLGALWHCYFNERKYQRAREIAELRLNICAESPAKKAESLFNLGESLSRLNCYQEAFQCHQQALELRQQEKSPETVLSYFKTALTLCLLPNDERLTSYFQNAYTLGKKLIKEKHPDIDKIGEAMAISALICKGSKGSIDFEKFVGKIRERFGEESLATAAAYQELGSLLKATTHHKKEVRFLFQRALDIQRNILGENNLTTAPALDGLGDVLVDLGQYDKALIYHEQALKIRRLVLGNDRLETGYSYQRVAVTLNKLSRYKEALEKEQASLEILRKSFGDEHLQIACTYDNIGSIFRSLGDYPNALDAFKKAVNIRNVLGEKQLETANSNTDAGVALVSLGRLDEAREYFEKAQTILLTVLGKHQDTAMGYYHLGMIAGCLGDAAKARELHLKSLIIRHKVFGEMHEDTANSYQLVGRAMEELGQFHEALKYMLPALEIHRKILGETHLKTADSYGSVGRVLLKSGSFREALIYLEEARQIRKNSLNLH